jgi:hypothetical protein
MWSDHLLGVSCHHGTGERPAAEETFISLQPDRCKTQPPAEREGFFQGRQWDNDTLYEKNLQS